MILNEVATDNLREILKLHHTQQLTLAGWKGKNAFDCYKASCAIAEEILKLTFPWETSTAARPRTRDEEIAWAYSSLVKQFGDPKKDPEAAERLKKTLDFLKAAREAKPMPGTAPLRKIHKPGGR